MKPHISTILKKGAKLKSRKLTKKDLELIEKTVKEQEKVPKSFRLPYAYLIEQKKNQNKLLCSFTESDEDIFRKN